VDARSLNAEKIAFSSNRKGHWDIYVMNPDGSNQVRLTNNQGDDFSPVWSPTSEQILFVSDRSGVADLYVIDADGRRLWKVFKDTAKRIEPAWAPDGKRIVFHAQLPQWSIQTATIHGRDVKQVASADPRGGNPSWSPDGTEIAFVDDVGGSRRIRILTLSSGAVQTFLPKKSPWMYSPAWSPDGERLAFSWYKWGVGVDKQALFIANADGSRLKQIGKSTPGTHSPSWSPEADKLVYAERDNNNTQQIVVIDVRSGRRTELTHRGSNITPDWLNPITLPVVAKPELLTTLWGEIKAD
ncbi:MAG: hypothetical protein OXI24_20275, partial [Candidatus Poribacteria bacterium]|nr:hypothetical protein [Candidatus Poribacteria bacterium]